MEERRGRGSPLQAALEKGRAVIPYLTASDPSDERFLEGALGAIEGGASALEIGIPHSDPVADGPVILRAHLRALAAGGGVQRTLALAGEIRSRAAVPIVLFTYLNPLLAFGPERFARKAREAGVDGILTLDIPPEEEPSWYAFMQDSGLDPIVLLSPNTSEERAARMASLGGGFVYLAAREGITGTHDGTRVDLRRRAQRARALSGLPVAAGFGVKSAQDVRDLWEAAEAAVVGSALIGALEAAGAARAREGARQFVLELYGNGTLAAETKEGEP